ncbi:MAG: hypothetical protein WKH64_06170 [Chloroflexia bacterium]
MTHNDERGASAADGLDGLTILRGNARQPGKTLETFPRPQHVHYIRMESDEVTGLCPITGQRIGTPSVSSTARTTGASSRRV